MTLLVVLLGAILVFVGWSTGFVTGILRKRYPLRLTWLVVLLLGGAAVGFLSAGLSFGIDILSSVACVLGYTHGYHRR